MGGARAACPKRFEVKAVKALRAEVYEPFSGRPCGLQRARSIKERRGCSTASTLWPSKAVQSVPSAPQLGILCLTVRFAAGRKPAASGGSSRLQPCRTPLPPPQLGELRQPHFRPARRASLVWPVCSVGPQASQPCIPTRLISGQLPPPGTTSTAWLSERNRGQSKTTREAAAASPPLRVFIVA